MRHVAALLVSITSLLAVAPPAWAGGEPPEAPTNGLKVTPGPGAEIVVVHGTASHGPEWSSSRGSRRR
jgi:hypothetical protein